MRKVTPPVSRRNVARMVGRPYRILVLRPGAGLAWELDVSRDPPVRVAGHPDPLQGAIHFALFATFIALTFV
jgi:hypothetical protein